MIYKILNLFGKGRYSTTYIVMHNNKKRVLKIGSYDNENHREKRFYKFINSLPEEEKKHFAVLHDYKIEYCKCRGRCKYDRATYDIPFPTKNNYKKKRLHIYHILEFKGSALNLRHNYTENQKIDIAKKIKNILHIIRKYGYIHGDIHTGNVCIDNMNVSIIDYDNISHKDIDPHKYLIDYDMIQFYNNIISQKGQMQGYNIRCKSPMINIQKKMITVIPKVIKEYPECMKFINMRLKDNPFSIYNGKWIDTTNKIGKIPKKNLNDPKFIYCAELFLMYLELYDKQLYTELFGFKKHFDYWIDIDKIYKR